MKKPIKGVNDLATIDPELAVEWHPTKNGGLTPSDFFPVSGIKVWWRGQCGHEWEATVAHRTYGRGCPYCCGQKVLQGYNDLATAFPEIAAEWHISRNGDSSPVVISKYSNRKVWWQCSRCGYEWQAIVNKRTHGTKCPNCTSSGTSFPEQAVFFYVRKAFPDAINRDKSNGFELDIYIPSKKVGIEYDGIVFHKTKDITLSDDTKDDLCLCAGIQLIRIRDHGLPPTKSATNIFRGESCKNQSLDNCIKDLLAILNVNLAVDIDSDFSDIMAQYYESEREYSLLANAPELAKQLHPAKNSKLDSSRISINSHLKVWWICEKGHEWQADVASRVSGNGCPYCSGRFPITGENDLATTYPEVAKEWHPSKNGGLLTTDVKQGTSKKVWWVCSKCGSEWEAAISSRTRLNCGCPYCGPEVKKIKAGLNDLTTTNPELTMEWNFPQNDNLQPSEVTKGTHRIVWWKCQECGREWKAMVKDRVRGRGCPVCAVERIRRAREKKVSQYSKEGELIKQYNSVTQASSETGILNSAISNACNELSKTAGGFIWKYED